MVKVLLIIALFAVPLANGWLLKPKKNWPVKAKGKVTCDGKPMPYVHIELMDHDFFVDQRMGTTKSDGIGDFYVSGTGRDGRRGKPDPYIRVSYRYAGYYGSMKVVNPIKFVRREKTGIKSYDSFIYFGTINFASIHCRTYNQYLKALFDFKIKTNHSLPYKTLYVITKAIIHGGTPFATTSTIRIPKKYNTISFTTAKHELAHTIRHSMDGGFAHFLRDVIKYKYTQHHTCGKQTNEGYAFNEGWAEYWAGSCYGYYGSAKNYKIEGNVAKALRKLHQQCSSSYKNMVLVLRYKKNNVHSFHQFNAVHEQLFNCKL